MTKIIFNGVDAYIELDNLAATLDYEIERHIDGSATLFTHKESFDSFEAIEIDIKAVPLDEDGDFIFNSSWYATLSGKIYSLTGK